jgi:pantetheine-phosphate adenylyltransferase
MQYKFHRSLVGGTFDRFHLGHRKLLTTAFEQSEQVIIGITTDELFNDKSFAQLIEAYKIREQSVRDFLSEKSLQDRFEIVPIHDFYGTSLTDKNLDAIFITESNKENVLKMNEEREKVGFKKLEIVIVPYVLGTNNKVISSERIRKGEIDREGNSYAQLFATQEVFILPESAREDLRHPIGNIEKDMQTVVDRFDKETIIIAVGDIVAESLAKIDRTAAVSVIDGRTRRTVLPKRVMDLFGGSITHQTENPAGTITKKGTTTLKKAISNFETTHKNQLIIVSGEEDLLAIPAILFSPLQSVVLYGQFDKGVVIVEVSEQNKKRVYDLFRKFQ